MIKNSSPNTMGKKSYNNGNKYGKNAFGIAKPVQCSPNLKHSVQCAGAKGTGSHNPVDSYPN